ncbi:tripartite tricarboxylate transporter TctB family protein [Pseudomonas sp. UBA2684]|uniref:tripartite tricarboxylate transporter TctB family protein n=1 Tax=Pseudomonas sp. UBA2684 TaxID=1947311 RepID=UPI000E849784|nr:tripartite tricarboxylate transporter TctB family protein [Pseudomonas sp. UBA2684]HBX55837.1 tripartite tricarboxylate transporter TctB family protein [Pseudomonas sp.]|tara:strand:- start:6892 stop:7380 length:489 start_codon:yes stop_codon:yes gene_type:complete
MATRNTKELLIGVAMLGVGLGYLLMTSQLPRHAGIDVAFVPYLLSAMLCLLGAIQLVSAFAAPKATEQGLDEEAQTTLGSIDVKTVIKTLALITGYIALLKTVGFPIMTAVYLYLQFCVLTPVGQKANHLVYGLIALISSATIYLLFREAFDLMLPSGLLGL